MDKNVLAVNDLVIAFERGGYPFVVEYAEDHLIIKNRSVFDNEAIYVMPLTYDEDDAGYIGGEDGVVMSYDSEIVEYSLQEVLREGGFEYSNVDTDNYSEFIMDLEEFERDSSGQ